MPGYTAKPALRHPYILDLKGVEASKNVVMNLDHDNSKRVGHATKVENTGSEILVEGLLSAETAHRDEVAGSAKNGFGWEVSIEGGLSGKRLIGSGKTETINGREVKGPVYVVPQAQLTGIAFVSHGADTGNQVSIAASADNRRSDMKDELKQFAMSLGVDVESADDEAIKNLEKQYELSQQTPPDPGQGRFAAAGGRSVSFDDLAAEAREEKERVQTIHQMGLQAMQENPNYHEEIQQVVQQAVETKLSADQFELSLLRGLRQVVGRFTASQGHRRTDPRIMECALALTAGLPAEKIYGADLCQKVEDVGMRGYTLQQAVLEAASMNGVRVRPGERINNGNIRSVFRAAFSEPERRMSLAGEWSNIDLPGILGAVANKSLLQGYMEADSTWTEISDVKSVTNFHVQNHYRMLDDLEYELVPPGGLIPHGTMAEETYTSQARTYAKMAGLTRQDLINDDLSAFDRIRTRLGMGAAMKFNNVVWEVFMNNLTHYTTARTNYIEGADSALDLAGTGLEKGVTAFRQQRSPDADGNKRVGATLSRPTVLLVPPELEFIAQRLYQSTNLQSGTTNDPGNPDANIHANQYRPVVQNRLSDPAFTGNSAAAWYLLGDMLKPVVVTFLNGQQTPTIESADADFNTLGVLFRGYHDFGADLGEYLGSIKSKGEA